MKKWRYLLIASLLVFGLACGLIDAARDLIPDEDDVAELVEGLVEDVVDELEDDDDADLDDSDMDDADSDDDMDDEDDASVSDDDEDSSSADGIDLDENGLENLNSYRQSLYFEMIYADGTEEIMDMELAATRDPAATQIIIESGGEEVEMIQIGDSVWIRFGEEWIASTSEDGGVEDFSEFTINESDLGMEDWDSDDYTYLGKETVNGIKTRYYEAQYSAYWESFLDDDEIGEIKDATAYFWVADENDLPKIVVKMEISVEGELEGNATSWTMTQELYDLNEPISIEAPEGVSSGLPEGVPEYPGATDFATFGGMTTFMTEDSVEDVTEFYRDALQSAGWSEDDLSELGGMVTASYSKDGQTLSLMVMSDDDGTSVMFMTE